MKIEKLQAELKDLLINNKGKQVFGLLKKELSSKSSSYNTFVQLSQRNNELQQRVLGELIEYSVASVEMNKINSALLAFIDSLTDEDINDASIGTISLINNPILMLVNDKGKIPEFENFFKQLNFGAVTIIHNSEEIDCTGFDVAIFDNRDLPKDREGVISELINSRVTLMESYINKTTIHLIHLGEFLNWINSNRERVYTANSKFSLYPRVKEMLDFINTYRV